MSRWSSMTRQAKSLGISFRRMSTRNSCSPGPRPTSPKKSWNAAGENRAGGNWWKSGKACRCLSVALEKFPEIASPVKDAYHKQFISLDAVGDYVLVYRQEKISLILDVAPPVAHAGELSKQPDRVVQLLIQSLRGLGIVLCDAV